VALEGGKEPLRAEYSAYTMGSDHDVYQDSSFAIPAIYLNDWPDRYIHTNFDTAANIDPTKLKRAAFIGAASGYFLAQLQGEQTRVVRQILKTDDFQLLARSRLLEQDLSKKEADQLGDEWLEYSYDREESLTVFAPWEEPPCSDCALSSGPFDHGPVPRVSGDGALKFRRTSKSKGPLAVFGYDYFADHAKAAGVATPKLLSYEGLWGAGEEYAYEVLNFANGKRTAQGIRDAVSAEYGPVPLEFVVEYLTALEKIGVVERVK